MRPLDYVTGRAIPLPRADVDTDQIIPAQHLKRTGRAGLGQFAFEAWRKQGDFVLDDPRYEGAPILLAGPNFGCGSSREHAPWALEDLGIRVIVAPSFADIFRSNCARVGLLTIALDASEVDELIATAQSDPETELDINLHSQTLTDAYGYAHRFEIDPFVKHCLLKGLDSIALSLAHEAAITAHEAARPPWMPRMGGAR